MGRPKVIFLAVVALLQSVAGDGASSFIVGGVSAAPGQFPAQVAIQVGGTIFCGGTILNQNHILTAASCVLDVNNNLVAANQVTVRGGELVFQPTQMAWPVNRIFPHPQYNPWSFENDIAVLRLENNIVFPQVPLPNIAAAQLNSRIVAEANECVVVGWNWTPQQPSVPLQALFVRVAPRTACNNLHQGMLRDSMICSEYVQQTNGVCQPSRGGGMYCNDLLTGVVSFGFGCGTNTTMTVHTQVRYYQPWIQQQFGRTDTPPAGTTPAPMPGDVGGGGGGGGAASSISLSLATIVVALVSALALN
ncbi:trypsin-like [Anopheles aquasalis]|uniref:trypsin-like n=1 Tax=Anopheles aquasalis TaxID=42839 RepID=UPI00215B6D6D|nr:trypsin-like [Anopheles aquasalis]